MRNIFLIFFCLLISAISSCNRCRNLDCYFGDTSGRFKIISKTNGNDLVFGSNSVYDKNRIKFYSLNGNDTSFFQYNFEPSLNGTFDSVIRVYFPESLKAQSFIKLSNADIDTLSITYVTENSKCCGIITNISKFIYNNTNDIGSNNEILTLKK